VCDWIPLRVVCESCCESPLELRNTRYDMREEKKIFSQITPVEIRDLLFVTGGFFRISIRKLHAGKCLRSTRALVYSDYRHVVAH